MNYLKVNMVGVHYYYHHCYPDKKVVLEKVVGMKEGPTMKEELELVEESEEEEEEYNLMVILEQSNGLPSHHQCMESM